MRGLFALLVFAQMLGASGAFAQTQLPATEARLLARVELDVAAGRTARAVRHLQRALQSPSPSAALALRYAQLALPCDEAPLEPSSMRHATTITDLSARASAPEDASDVRRQLLLHAAWAEAVLERWDAALAAVTSAGRRDDALTQACLTRISAHAVRLGALDVASAALSLARNYAPTEGSLARDHGLVLLALGDVNAALTPLSERLALAPHDLSAREDVAYALLAAGRASDALEVLLRKEEPCRADPSCLMLMSRAALEAGLPHDAAVLAGELVAREPQALDALFLLAEAHTRAGTLDAARETYRRILAQRPDSARARHALEALEAESAR